MEIKDIVAKSVQQINDRNVANTEETVRNLVNAILHEEAKIAQSKTRIAEYKEELNKLQMPAPVSVEL